METMNKAQRTALIQREVKKAQHELDEFNQAQKVTPLDLMLDQGEIERYILAGNVTPDERKRVGKIWSHDEANELNILAIFPPVLFGLPAMAVMVTLGIHPGVSAVIVFTLALTVSILFAASSPETKIKLFQGRKVVEEASRILSENQHQSARHRELVDNADKNLAKAKKRLDNIASLYEKSNPSRRLAIAADNSRIVEVHSDAVIQRALGSETALEAVA